MGNHMETHMKATQLKAMTGAKTRAEAETILYRQFEARRWVYRGHVAQCAGMERRKDRVHFTATWSAGPGVAGHRRVALSMEQAVSNQTGILDNALVLC